MDAPGTGFDGMDLPFAYSSPCIKGEGAFSFFFYWDTYFTNLGLLRTGHADIAKSNIKNVLWFIKRQGYMPNHTGIFNRSQPPYLARMVREYLACVEDEAFLKEAAEGLRQEYLFWTTARHTPTGLQCHGQHETAEGCARFYEGVLPSRLGVSLNVSFEDKVRIGGHFIAEAETGWDFTQRFDSRCDEHAAVDLNGLLFEYETFLAEVAVRLEWDDAPLWQTRAEQRCERVNHYLWNEEKGWFFDYDFVNARQSDVYSLAGMLPLFTGMATPEQAARVAACLPMFECEHGIAVTNDRPGARSYQWAFPHVWPPFVYITVEGLRRYGYDQSARHIAKKFIRTTTNLFNKSGQLWEKTDAETGEVGCGEYEAAPMLGWTAGVFIALHGYLDGCPSGAELSQEFQNIKPV